MNLKTLLTLAALLAAVPALAPEAQARRGADDPAGHDAGDDNGGRGRGTDDPAGHDAGDDKGGRGRGTDDPAGHDAGDDRGGSRKSGDSGGRERRARRDLLRDPASPDPDVRGHVEVRSREGRERFQVEAERLDPGTALEVLVEDATGALVTAGSPVVGTLGEAELELDTGDGAVLPAGAAAAAELAGRRVEVRDGSGSLLLSGTVPSLDGSGGSLSGVTRVGDDGSGVRVKVRMRQRGKSGRQEFRMEVKGVPSGAAMELWIDDGSGTLVPAGMVPASGGGRGRLRLSSKSGDAMPLAAEGVEALAGRAFELRVEGTVVASGNLPDLR